MRKTIDALTKKIEILKSKLQRFGTSRIPASDIEKKIFYTNTDRTLEHCNLVHEIHE